MNPEEYLPPENDQTAIVVADNSALTTTSKFIRIKCDGCSKEVGLKGTHEQAAQLLEFQGWKIGREMLCPDCVEKAAKQFFKRYAE